MKYWNLVKAQKKADLYIYGDITSDPWDENDVASAPLVKALDALEADEINVFINSYGGEVAEGMAICSALNRHPAKVTTICDGFACSSASNIFMAGDERMMNESSLLFIHNAWALAVGNAGDMRKAADDLDKISQTALLWYAPKLSISVDELTKMIDEETFIVPEDAVRMGFATGIIKPKDSKSPSQNARQKMMARMTMAELSHIEMSEPAIEIRVMDIPELQEKLNSLEQAIMGLQKTEETKETREPKTYRQRMKTLLEKTEA